MSRLNNAPSGQLQQYLDAQPKQQRPMQVKTSIKPQGIFPTDYTRQAGNLASALSMPGRADVFGARGMKGVASSSPMLDWQRGTDFAGSMAQSMMAPQQIQLGHQLANAQNILQGQQQREGEAQQWAGLGLQGLGIQQGMQGNLLGFLRSMYRPLG